VIRRIAAIGLKFSEFEFTAWSLFLSLFVYVPFSLTTGLNNLDVIRDQLFNPFNFILLIVYTLLVGSAIGLALKPFRKGIRLGDTWERVAAGLFAMGSGWAIVYTENGSEYKGKVHMMGIEENPREILLRNPVWIVRNETHDVIKEIAMGTEILFTEKDVRRIVLFDNIPDRF
jgi:hypothetical protein